MPMCQIPMQPCSSSQITEFGYDPATKRLAIRFKSKTPRYVYQYDNVPEDVARALRDADADAEKSVGKTFGELVKGKPDLYPFTKIDELEDEPKEPA